jgi:hypothetical protein
LKARQDLPSGYRLARSIDLRKQPGLLLWLNLVGLGLLLLFAWLFNWLASELRAPTEPVSSAAGALFGGWETILVIVPALVAVLLLHELVHGLFFWLLTRSRPYFGLKITYAYAAAPDWYIPRNPYLVVGLSPLTLITLVGVALMPVLPEAWVLPWVLALALNASGSVGDVYIIGWLLSQPGDTLVNDHGDSIHFYLPGSL